MAISVVAGFLVGAFNPYITNTVIKHNPVYPLIGEDKIDIMSIVTPQNIEGKCVFYQVKDVYKRQLIGYAVITVLCYLQYPNCWFGGDDEQSLARMKSSLEDRGLIRFTLPCKMLVPLFLFMEIQSLGLWVNNKMKIFILFILLLFIGNRFPLVISLLVIGYMICLLYTSCDFYS